MNWRKEVVKEVVYETFETYSIRGLSPGHYQKLTAVKLPGTGGDRHLEYRKSTATFEQLKQVTHI